MPSIVPTLRDLSAALAHGHAGDPQEQGRGVGGHVFGHIYVGGIGLVLTPFFHGLDKAEEILKLCIGCRKCNEVCAAEIDIEGLIVDLRAAYLAQKPFQSAGGRIRHLPMILNRETANRSLPPIAEVPFRDLMHKRPQSPALAVKQEKVLFYSGCLADFVYPEMCNDTVASLEGLGYRVAFPQEQSCCGIPARVDALARHPFY